VTFAGNAPTAGSLVLADNSALTRVFRSVSASGWVATWGGIQVVNFEQAETWIARGATSDDDVNGETAGTSCSNPDYIAGPTAADVQIQLGINLTLPGGIVHLCPGTYDVDEEIRLDGIDITLQGAGASETILDGGNTFVGGVSQNTGNTIITTFNAITVNGIGFQNGYTAEGGGAINAGTAIINDSTFSNNTAGFGGAIWCFDGSTITNSTFTSNTAGDGGAIWCYGATSISNGIFTDNSAKWGGAINAMSTTVTKSVFRSNHASLNGGGIYAAETAMVTGSAFTGNDSGKNGGAIYADTSATITNSTFKNNSAAIDGGAISTSTATVTASTFTHNSAEYGGAITAPFATVTRSRFTGNSASSLGGAFFTYDGTIQRSRFTRNAAGEHGGAVAFWAANSDTIQRLRRNTFTRNTAPAGGAITLRACAPSYSRSQVRRIERASYFSRNRATEQRRTENVERWIAVEYCG